MAYFSNAALCASTYGRFRICIVDTYPNDSERTLVILAGAQSSADEARLADEHFRRLYKDEDDGYWYLAPLDDD